MGRADHEIVALAEELRADVIVVRAEASKDLNVL
jgi:hypothetical protein